MDEKLMEIMDPERIARVIAQNLRRIAFEHDKNQSDICRDLNISPATLSSWFNGTRIPRLKKIDLLCEYFNVSRSDILEPQTEDKPLSRRAEEYARAIDKNDALRLLIEAALDKSPEAVRKCAELLSMMPTDASD